MHKTVPALALLAAALGGCAGSATREAPVTVPQALQPAPGSSLALVTAAEGVQIYECRAVASRPGTYEWAFVAPQAELFDLQGNRIGRHYAGPHWEAADGSRIVAAVKARADAPQPGAIPWLLLSARSVGPEGKLSKVTSIQRANTVGGLAPRNGCSRETAGTPARVRYTAHYYFFSDSR